MCGLKLSDIQIIGIIGGLLLSALAFLLNALTSWRAIISRRLQNAQEITKSHRDLWKLTIDKPEAFARVLQIAPDLLSTPITYAERRFVHLLLLHAASTYDFMRWHDLAKIEQMKFDVDELLALPIPRLVWSQNKHYFNRKFVHFVERKPRALLFWRREQKPPYALPFPSKFLTIIVRGAYGDRLTSFLSQWGDRVLFQDEREAGSTPETTDVIVQFDEAGSRSQGNAASSSVPLFSIQAETAPNTGEVTEQAVPSQELMVCHISTCDHLRTTIITSPLSFVVGIDSEEALEISVEERERLFRTVWPYIRSGQEIRGDGVDAELVHRT